MLQRVLLQSGIAHLLPRLVAYTPRVAYHGFREAFTSLQHQERLHISFAPRERMRTEAHFRSPRERACDLAMISDPESDGGTGAGTSPKPKHGRALCRCVDGKAACEYRQNCRRAPRSGAQMQNFYWPRITLVKVAIESQAPVYAIRVLFGRFGEKKWAATSGISQRSARKVKRRQFRSLCAGMYLPFAAPCLPMSRLHVFSATDYYNLIIISGEKGPS